MSIEAKSILEIADDYVLGLLDTDELIKVEARIDSDTALQAAVASARERFLPLDLTAAPATVTGFLWTRIEQALPPQAATAPSQAVSTPGPGAVPGAAAVPPRPVANDNAAGRWRKATILSTAASLVLALGLSWSLLHQSEPMVVAVLLNAAGEPQAIVEDFGNDTASIRLLSDFTVPDDKVMQVWTLPTREMGPVSLGLLTQQNSTTLAGPGLPPPQDAQLYEITLEQTGGSPTGRPTGPILVKGFAKLPR